MSGAITQEYNDREEKQTVSRNLFYDVQFFFKASLIVSWNIEIVGSYNLKVQACCTSKA